MSPLDGCELTGCYGGATEHCTLAQGNSCRGVSDVSDLHTHSVLLKGGSKCVKRERHLRIMVENMKKKSGLLLTLLFTNDRSMHVRFSLVQTKYALFK